MELYRSSKMQKLVWQNANGVELDLTSGNYGITEWEGFSNTSLNIQTQTVPFQDGGVFLDALMEQRELSVTLAIQDNNNLETRYEKRREIISAMNPKLGEGYLLYTNDFISKRIRCIPQLPIFETHNSNDSGTPKASLAWTACNPYWEDLEETNVMLGIGQRHIVKNNGDVLVGVKVDLITNDVINPQLRNFTENKAIKLNGAFQNNINIETNTGNKKITSESIVFKAVNDTIQKNGITYSEELGMLVMVGDGGIIKTSVDNIEWTQRESGTSSNLNAVKWVKEKRLFIAVGDYDYENEKITILLSSDGIKWEPQEHETLIDLFAVTYSTALHIFVAAGDGEIITSPDGITWTDQGISTKWVYYGATCSDSIIVIVGKDGHIITSTDGETWVEKSTSGSNLYAVIYNSNGFLAVGAGGVSRASTDGESWNTSSYGTNSDLHSIAYDSNTQTLVVVGNSGMVIANGTVQTSIVNTNLYGVVYSEGMGLFVVVGNIGTVIDSYDGAEWDNKTTQIKNTLWKVIKAKGKYWGVGESKYIITSYDGKEWDVIDSGITASYYSIVYSEEKDLFVVTGLSGVIITSPDGENWTLRTSGVGQAITDVTYGEGAFVAVGSSGTIILSEDGTTWETVYTQSKELHSVAYSKKLRMFIAVGENGALFRSSDGAFWVSPITGVSNNLEWVIYSEEMEKWVVVGNRCVLTSQTGRRWNNHTLSSDIHLYGVDYSTQLEKFIAVGLNGVLLESNDGELWDVSSINFDVQLNYILCTEDKNLFIIVGTSGIIFNAEFIAQENLISTLTTDSDMTLGLEIGINELLISKSGGSLKAKLTYRQKYIGV
jgi:hypothetical protein